MPLMNYKHYTSPAVVAIKTTPFSRVRGPSGKHKINEALACLPPHLVTDTALPTCTCMWDVPRGNSVYVCSSAWEQLGTTESMVHYMYIATQYMYTYMYVA